ncbi:MAG: 16S rRNA (cytidine(1402)-2'-O)-methyltransferase [Clostridia bacterium]|nr:16S rRNA (cytidine(1402)-2'-O)-methyltransferase [Clostridia bacterium]
MESGVLYLCATPIGNLDDITVRCLNTLRECDLIACEDTRHSKKLLTHFDIHKPLTSYFEHNRKEKGQYIINEIKSGKNVALITDAGTPAISDPGEDLVKMCIGEGVRVVPVPGSVALINALIISGQNTARFAFEGFLSMNKKSRYEHLESVKDDSHTLIFYEAPHKLVRTLNDMRKYFGNRSLSIVRELTKIHEECKFTTIDEAIAFYEETAPKGEYVLIVEGKNKDEIKDEQRQLADEMSIAEHVKMLMDSGHEKKDAMKIAAKERGLSKRDIYNQLIKEDTQ